MRALGAIGARGDLRVLASVAEVAGTDADKDVRQAALNALVALGIFFTFCIVEVARDMRGQGWRGCVCVCVCVCVFF